MSPTTTDVAPLTALLGSAQRGDRRAFEELRALPRLPWRPALPHLLEQYSWSLASSRRGGRVLPVTFNWAPHFLGESPSAVVNHYFGLGKWREPKV